MNDIEKWKEALREVENEAGEILSGKVSLADVLTELGPMPREVAFLGMVEDGLPLLFNLKDAAVGSIMIVGDKGCGKIDMLRTMVGAIGMMHSPKSVQVAIITNRPEKWDCVKGNNNVASIFPSSHKGAEDMIASLVSWAHGNNANRSVVFIFDGFEDVLDMDFDAKQDLRLLILKGSEKGVRVVVSLDSDKVSDVYEWLEPFRTRIYGRISNGGYLRNLGFKPSDFSLFSHDFVIPENGTLVRFWIPSV